MTIKNKKPRKHTQKDGTITYKLNEKLHRENGPAVELTNGHKEWYLNDRLHRTNGPAREWADGHKEWFKHGELHREDGPAVEYSNGSKVWYLNGKELTEKEFNEIRKKKNEYKFIPGKIDISICPVCDNENKVNNKQYAICDNCKESYIVV